MWMHFIPNSNNIHQLKVYQKKMQNVWIFLVLALTKGAWCGTGEMTFYYEWRGNHGSCGLDRAKTDHFYVAALSTVHMKLSPGVSNPNKHPLCQPDRCVEVTGKRGKVVLKISDTCVGCKENDIDVAHSVFPMLDDPNQGRVKVSWNFVNCQSNPPGKK